MSPEKFMGWLEGYLEAHEDGLSQKDIEKIQKKMKKVVQPPNITISPAKTEPFPYIPHVPTYPDTSPFSPTIIWSDNTNNKIDCVADLPEDVQEFWKSSQQ